MAFPGKQRGHVQLTDLLDPSRTMLPIIPAHENTISSLILNHNGSLVATASEKGTLIRVYDTAHGKLLHEFRRGTDQAMIYRYGSKINRYCGLIYDIVWPLAKIPRD